MINNALRKSLVPQMRNDLRANSNVAQLFPKLQVPRTTFDYITIFHYAKGEKNRERKRERRRERESESV